MQLTYHLGHRKHCPARLEMLRPFVSGRVLDVGCSEGFFSFGLAGEADYVLAIDTDPALIALCRQQPQIDHVKFRHEDVWELSHRRAFQFDTTLYMSVHHHLIAARGINEADEVLRGLLAMTRGNLIFDMGQKDEKRCGSYAWWKALPDEHPRIWVPKKLQSAGAQEVECIGSTVVHDVPRWLWRASS